MKIQYSKKAVRFLKKLEKEQCRWIHGKIQVLVVNPVPADAKTLSGYKELIFRIRVGNYRIMYEWDKKGKTIGIIKIDKRGRAYK